MTESDDMCEPAMLPRAPRIFLMGASPSLTDGHLCSASEDMGRLTSAAKLQITGHNTGNQIIAYGLLKTVEYSAVSWDSRIGPERVNAEYDLILIAAANFLHSGFDFTHMTKFIEATNLPCTMIGVGAQSKDYSTEIALLPGTDRLMRVVAERSKLIGARGSFTADVLARMGIHNVQITGCPSYYMGAKPQLLIRKPVLTADSRLLVNASRDVVSHSFDRVRMIAIVSGILSTAIERNADFVAQSELPEITIADTVDAAVIEINFNQIINHFPAFRQIASNEKLLGWFSQHMRVFWDVAAWYAAMKNYDFVYGNRFHGAMIALQAGTAACVICHDTRTSELCEFLKLPSVGLKDVDNVEIDALYERVNPDAIQARYLELYPRYKDFLRANGVPTALE